MLRERAKRRTILRMRSLALSDTCCQTSAGSNASMAPRILVCTMLRLGPSNGSRPLSSMKRMQPQLHTSAGLPLYVDLPSCSGAMKFSVPEVSDSFVSCTAAAGQPTIEREMPHDC